MKRKDRDNPEYREKNRKYQNDWYHQNKESARATRKKRYDEMQQKYRDYKLTKSCIKCGENHPSCLDFHHPDPKIKDVNPSELISKKGWSFEKIAAELDLLEVLCSNCHRKVHAEWRSSISFAS